MDHVKLTKHHGLGNDFLVLIDLDDDTPIDADLARLVCDRHRGVGADGLIHVSSGRDGAALTMDLRNSDGSSAEMSGNGMRCLVQAALMAGVAPAASFTVATDGGVRDVSHRIGDRPGESWVSVDMGPTAPAEVAPDTIRHQLVPHKTATIDIGNPHVVMLVDDPAEIDVAGLGAAYEAQFPSGANVEWLAPTGDASITMRVWERGAGVTQACGTGACASARAAHEWGLVGPEVKVTMPGGTVEVSLGDTVVLSGPATFIGAVELDRELLAVSRAVA